MLGKTIKYEIKDTSRVFLILYAALIAIAIVNKLAFMVDLGDSPLEILQVVIAITYVLGIIALSVITVVFIVKRFYDNMLKDQGYLTFTLPVTTNAHVFAKMLTSLIWTICSCVVVVAAVAIMIIGEISLDDIGRIFHEVVNQISQYEAWGVAIKLAVMLLIAALSGILQFYLCMSVGQLANKHKVAGAVGTYFGIYFIMQMISLGIVRILALIQDDSLSYYYSNYTDIIKYYVRYLDMWLNAYIILYIVTAVVFYIGTVLLLDEKLNLE